MPAQKRGDHNGHPYNNKISESETILFTRLLKFIIIIGILSLGLFLLPQRTWAVDSYYPYAPVSSIYGDINLEFRAQGAGGQGSTSQMAYDFIHYYNLGFSSYIWDPRLIQYNLQGRFYQNIPFGDENGQETDSYRFGGSGSINIFPYSVFRTTLTYGRDMNFNPDITITHYGVDALLFKKKWPVVGISLGRDQIFSDDKDFPQDEFYTYGHLRLNHEIYFKAKRSSSNNIGNNNGNGENGEQNNDTRKKSLIAPNRLLINVYYDFYSFENNLNNISNLQQRAQLRWDYFFNNNKSQLTNSYDWNMGNDDNHFGFFLQYINRLPTQLTYVLSGNAALSLSANGGNSFSGGLSANLTKIFSPQWTASAGVVGQFSSGNGNANFGISGFGSVFSRIFKDFDWGAGMSANLSTGEGDSNFNYSLNLIGTYRLSPNKLLYGDYTLSLNTGDRQEFDNRLRLTFEGYWYPRLTLRSVAEFRLQDRGETKGGNDMSLSLDNYIIYRLSSYTTFTGGLYFSHIAAANTDSEQRLRAYVTISSSPWWNFNYSLTADAYYEIQKAQWNIRIYPQIFYRWRKLYFSLTGNLKYFTTQNSKSGWNYDLTFKVTRPFNIRF